MLQEHWPLSDYTSQWQIEGLVHRRGKRQPQSARRRASRLKFLRFMNAQLGRIATHRYFEKVGAPIRGKILEQGAGICGLSSYLSTFPAVDEIVSLELSEERFHAFRESSLSLSPGADPKKIRYVVGDMHHIEVPDSTFDVVVCDAVLHHADNLIAMLRESRRALNRGGRARS